MTGAALQRRVVTVRSYHAYGSTLLAIGLSVALIVAGYGVKVLVESRTAEVSAAGITAVAPHGWRSDSTSNELIVRHPGDANTLYAATLIESTQGELADVAAQTILDRSGLLLGFQVTGQGPVRIGDRDGYQIRYVYVSQPGQSSAPQLIEGMDLYVPADGGVIGASYEAPREHFAEDYAGFERFAASVRRSAQ